MMLKIALVLPSDRPVELRLEQRLKGLRTHFGDEIDISVATQAPSGLPEWARDELSFLPNLDVDAIADCDHVVMFAEASDAPSHAKRRYRLFSNGKVLPEPGIAIDLSEDPHLEDHPYNHYSQRGTGDADFASFRFFPFGYLYRLTGMGPLDTFGHRIAGDYRELAEREADHKLVLCYGGSTVFGISVLFDQCFPAQLEAMLNERAESQTGNTRVTVLNFGVPGGTVLSATQRFALLAMGLKADVVIAHDGINDMFYGDTSDPFLLSEHQIVCPQNFDHWAQALFDPTYDATAGLPGGPTNTKTGSPPISILKAYLRRKREFATIAKATGAKFISGLQPFCESKPNLTSTEQRRIDNWRGSPPQYESEFALIRALYGIIEREQPDLGADLSIDFHQMFAAVDREENHFADMVHLDVEGEKEVAGIYADAITNLMNWS